MGEPGGFAYGQYVSAEDVLGDEDDEQLGPGAEASVMLDDVERGQGPEARPSQTEHQAAAAFVFGASHQPPNTQAELSGAAPHDPGPLSGGLLPGLQAPPTEEVRTGAPVQEAEAHGVVLPPAVGSRCSSRKSSHAEASTSAPAAQRSTSPGSLPPIHPRGSGGGQAPRGHPPAAGVTSSNRLSPGSAAGSMQGSPQRGRGPSSRQWHPKPQKAASQQRPPSKPQPRARHDVTAVDPLFLQTAVYRDVPGVGKMYDWKMQHEVNQALTKQRKHEAQMVKVLEAARVQLEVRDANERAFKQWMATKEQEKVAQAAQSRRIAAAVTVYQQLIKEDGSEQKAREALWVDNFTSPFAASGTANGGRGIEEARLERFRM